MYDSRIGPALVNYYVVGGYDGTPPTTAELCVVRIPVHAWPLGNGDYSFIDVGRGELRR